jgi:hypothetical protein
MGINHRRAKPKVPIAIAAVSIMAITSTTHNMMPNTRARPRAAKGPP